MDVSREQVRLSPEELAALRHRLHRVQGQVNAIVGMLDGDGRSCREIVHVVAAASGALDRVGRILLNRAMRQWAADPDASEDELVALEKLFLDLA